MDIFYITFANKLSSLINKYPTFFLIACAIFTISLLDNIIIVFMKYNNQKKFLKELYLERERYKMIIEELDEIIFDYDVINNQVITSSQFKKLFGKDLYNVKCPSNNIKIKQIYENVFNLIIENSKLNQTELLIEKIQLINKYKNCSWYSIKIRYIYHNSKLVRIIGKIIDIDDSITKYELLEIKSQRDPLTQLYNKSAFFTQVEKYLKQHKNSKCALIFLDLDNFKLINDNFGHLTGDNVIKES